MPLRDHRTGQTIALATIPEWTRGAAARRAIRGTALRIGSLSEQHAARVWTDTRTATANRAATYRQQAGTNDPSGLVILDFVSRLAGHLVACHRCHVSTGTDPGTPEAWLVYAIGQRPQLKAALAPILREQGHKVATLPPGTAQLGRTASKQAGTG